MRLQGLDTFGLFAGLLRDTMGNLLQKGVGDEVWLEALKSQYVPRSYVPELKDQDRKGDYIKKGGGMRARGNRVSERWSSELWCVSREGGVSFLD